MNLTVSIDDDTLARAKEIARQRGVSLEQLIVRHLEELTPRMPAEHMIERRGHARSFMAEAPIVEEIHKIREQLLEEHGGFDGYMKHIEELQDELKERIVSRDPRPPFAPNSR